MGILPSHIGFEGIVSKDNWNYSRSLLADYSPYYETGVSLTATLSERLTLRGLILNGWQNINETNNDKAVGTQVQYKPSPSLLINWSTFVGNEQPDSVASRLRIFNDLYAQYTISDQWSAAMVFDLGFQHKAIGSSYDAWDAAALMAKYTFDQQWGIGVRVEYYLDKFGVIIPTGTPGNFQTVAGSINLDFAPASSVLWRVEMRIFDSKDRVYPTQTGFVNMDGFLVVSAAISL
jgi:hypothetical protein